MQVILCLQSNAVKFTQNGTIKIVSEIFKCEEATYLEVSVVDSGIGIALEDQSKLFKLFGLVQDR